MTELPPIISLDALYRGDYDEALAEHAALVPGVGILAVPTNVTIIRKEPTVTTTAQHFRSKPVTIQAVQLPSGSGAVRHVAEWMVDNGYRVADPTPIEDADPTFVYGDLLLPEYGISYLEIETLEGTMTARSGDWVILGTAGEFYPCRDDVFQTRFAPLIPQPMREQPLIIGERGDRQLVTVEIEDAGRRAIQDFLLRHDAELREELAQVGVDWGTVAQPAWMRALSVAEVTAELERTRR